MSESEIAFDNKYPLGTGTQALLPKQEVLPSHISEIKLEDKRYDNGQSTIGTTKPTYGNGKPRRITIRAKLTND